MLFGYSRGGTSAIKLANMLGRVGVTLNHLVVFDAHSIFDSRTFHLLYDNVLQAHNFFREIREALDVMAGGEEILTGGAR
ncbi:hypothetical protein P3339_06360 [Microbulbifer sp. MLAF003]|uniref:hypothetical protein n=1 Tax=Microbulbifer sp. MLAF003 TaxID=3032582 RepID=UPI0024AD3200|nr:hypothetical protein [Microbulbifer sp. MLAF003]WHI52400.1 hypothetical protein P3339_06360 [Microbulbifer sp. MLAF003]